MKTKSSNRAKWLYTSMVFACLVAVITLSIGSLKAEVPTENDTENKVMTAGTAILSENTLYFGNAKIVNKDEIATNPDTTKKSDLIIESADKSNMFVIVGQGDLKNPLYIVDGVEIEDISGINPDNVANIDVLKGKKATDAYGEKGKNGVIIITKKKPTIELKPQTSSDINSYIKPLYIVDGVETKGIEGIDPADIHNISVLKDKNTISIYGEKGKNGVVIITTKRAAANETINTRLREKDTKSNEPLKRYKNENHADKLIIIDGLEGKLEDVNAKDIESISVLKGKNTEAIYGERGKNGVIVVTTKKNNKKAKSNTASKEQLVIIDGKEGKLEDINTEDIESCTILKNEAATDRYGERGKNGVMIIKSKKGTPKSTSQNIDNVRMSFSGENPNTGKKIRIAVTDDKIITEGVNDHSTAIFINGKLASKAHLDALNPKHILGGTLGSKEYMKELVKKHKIKQEWIFLVNTNSNKRQ